MFTGNPRAHLDNLVLLQRLRRAHRLPNVSRPMATHLLIRTCARCVIVLRLQNLRQHL
jgi:hypothetical protein